MECGSEFLSVEYGIQADVALLGEPSGIDGPEFEFLHLLSRGLSCFKIRVRGTQMHSSLTDRVSSISANVALARVLLWMVDHLELTFQPHPLCAAPTINLGVVIDGGVGYGVCPGVAEFQSDIRVLPGMTRGQLEEDITRCLDRLRREDPRLNIEFAFAQPPLDWFPPTEVPASHPLVESLLVAAARVLGWRPKLSAFPGGTDAKNFQDLAGIPTIRYASHATGGAGELHDSDPTVADATYEYLPDEGMPEEANIEALVGKPYPLHNWSIAFEIKPIPGHDSAR